MQQGIEVGDAEAVRDEAAGRAAASRSHDDALLAGEVVEVPDDQEVGRVPRLADDRKLDLGALGDGRGWLAIPPRDAIEHQVAQVLVRGHSIRHVEGRQESGAKL